ncbi:MAG: hypothetical protein R2750_12600 [Bacteroidales bacterium]
MKLRGCIEVIWKYESKKCCGLNNLRIVNRYMQIDMNSRLIIIEAFDNVLTIDGFLSISANGGLAINETLQIDGFNKLETMGHLIFTDNFNIYATPEFNNLKNKWYIYNI